MTLEQVGQDFGVTRERIRQMEIRTLRRLQKFRMARALQDATSRTDAHEGLTARVSSITPECAAPAAAPLTIPG